MREKKLKNFSGEFKAQVALEAIREVQTVNEIVQEFGVHPTQSVGGSGKSRRRADSMPHAAPRRGITLVVERLWRSVKHEDVYLKGSSDLNPRLGRVLGWIA